MRNLMQEKEQAAAIGELVRQGKFVDVSVGASLEHIARALEGKEVTWPFLMRFCFLSGLELGVSTTMVLAAHARPSDLTIFNKLAKELDKVRAELKAVLAPTEGNA